MRNTKRQQTRRRLALISALLTGLVAPVFATSNVASASGIRIATGSSKYYTPGKTSPVKGVKVSGLEGKQVIGSLRLLEPGTLSLGSTTGLTLSYGYFTFSGRDFAFTGTQDAINAALQTLTVTTPSSSVVPTVTVKTMFAEARDGLVYYPNNQHFYQYVKGKISGTDAFQKAATQTSFGLTGYLATITSAEENEFLARKIEGAVNVWVNGTDSADEGNWTFSGGPESGQAFWKGWEAEFTANPGTPVNGSYTSWAANEPNNWNRTYHEVENSPTLGEDCIVLNKYSPTSAPPNNLVQYEKWNDISCSFGLGNNDLINGYIVEFGSRTNGSTFDSTVAFADIRLARTIPTQKLSAVEKIVKAIFGGKKALPKGFKIFTLPKKNAPKQLCPTGPKMTKISYTLVFSEVGRYSFYFTNSAGKRIPMECGTIVNKRVITETISAPVIQTVKVDDRAAITAYIRTSSVGKDPKYPLLNVILRRPDGTLQRVDQPSPPLPGPTLKTPGVYQTSKR